MLKKDNSRYQEVERLLQCIDTEMNRLAEKWNQTADDLLSIRFLRYVSDVAARRTHRKRLVVSSSYWALSVRIGENSIELFSLPATHVAALFEEETATRLKFKLRCQKSGGSYGWFLDSARVEHAEINLLLRTAFKELTSRSLQEANLSGDHMEEIKSDDISLMGKLRALISDKYHFAEKLVVQQEAVQAEIARNIHDGAIGRLMVLKSGLLSCAPPRSEEIVDCINEAIDSLRETCRNLSPRDLRDWGLAVVAQDMVNGLAKRTSADCDIVVSETLPALATDVELNVFRIIQELLTNVEKHAGATEVRVTMQMDGEQFIIEVKDNGKGIASQANSGSGLNIMRERLELIRSTHPASLTINGGPGRGTCVKLVLSGFRKRRTESGIETTSGCAATPGESEG